MVVASAKKKLYNGNMFLNHFNNFDDLLDNFTVHPISMLGFWAVFAKLLSMRTMLHKLRRIKIN